MLTTFFPKIPDFEILQAFHKSKSLKCNNLEIALDLTKHFENLDLISWEQNVHFTKLLQGVPLKKVSTKNFNSDLLIL